jgi:hypothetical protein
MQSFNGVSYPFYIFSVLTHFSMIENINIAFTSPILLALFFKYNFLYERSTKSYWWSDGPRFWAAKTWKKEPRDQWIVEQFFLEQQLFSFITPLCTKKVNLLFDKFPMKVLPLFVHHLEFWQHNISNLVCVMFLLVFEEY